MTPRSKKEEVLIHSSGARGTSSGTPHTSKGSGARSPKSRPPQPPKK